MDSYSPGMKNDLRRTLPVAIDPLPALEQLATVYEISLLRMKKDLLPYPYRGRKSYVWTFLIEGDEDRLWRMMEQFDSWAEIYGAD